MTSVVFLRSFDMTWLKHVCVWSSSAVFRCTPIEVRDNPSAHAQRSHLTGECCRYTDRATAVTQDTHSLHEGPSPARITQLNNRGVTGITAQTFGGRWNSPGDVASSAALGRCVRSVSAWLFPGMPWKSEEPTESPLLFAISDTVAAAEVESDGSWWKDPN